ncbi:F-box domain-containing protein [Caenorhabditis elegans]|uniref:F-box domain-containing protein n=1 Tax=Caenorhabditis elegans TaxID=6239 RepID=Q9N5W7_CAEEL|nr:F-box domain-containing protein [Caenorhabditis elegans]CCD67057.1 F-box domain-containing protein [Caenorhabditis elegans]|eukprot:NP_001254856.1 Uncharacterized protein CELE_C39B5.2 [Caenorhabditis elegans]
MPFKVFNFPLSVRRQIVSELNILDVFNFSVCSPKTKSTTENIQKDAFIMMKHICQRTDAGELHKIIMENDESNTHLTVRFEKVDESQVGRYGKLFKWVIGKNAVTCCICITSNEEIVFYFNGSALQDVHQEVYNVIDNIHMTAKNEVAITLQKNETRPSCLSPGESEYSCCLPKLKNADEISIFAPRSRLEPGIIINYSFLDDVFLKCPNSQVARIYGLIDSRIKKECCLFDVKEHECGDLGPMAYRIMSMFRGQHLSLKAVLTTEPVISYLKHWASGRKHQNIETLEVGVEGFVSMRYAGTTILEELKARPWNGARRPRNYIFSNKTHGKPQIFDCVKWFDIKGDGKLASILVGHSDFKMVVWNGSATSLLATCVLG